MTDNKGNSCWLENAIQYTNYPFGSKFEYAPLFNNSIRVNRFQFCPQGKNGVVITYTIENVSDSEQTVLLILSQKQICCLYGHPGQSG